MTPIRRAGAAALMLALAVAALAVAAPPAAATGTAPLTAEQQTTLDRVVAYLNGIDSVEARFIQFDSGGVAEGRLHIDRPGRMRLEYDPPVPILMVARDPWLMYVDRDLRQTSFVSLSSTPAGFLLRAPIVIDESVVVTGVESALNVIRVSVRQAGNPEAGTLTLVLEDAPLRLVKWRVVDAQGKIVDVALTDARFGVPLESGLFSIVDPYLNDRRRE